MITRFIFRAAVTALLYTATGVHLPGQDTNAPPRPPSREEIKQQLQGLTPEERKAKLNELRAKYGRLDPQAAANPFDKLGSTNSVPPPTSLQASNLARLRARGAQPTAEQNRARMAVRIAELRKKQEAGTLTVEEKRLLDAWDLRLKSGRLQITNATPAAPEPPALPPARSAPQ